MSATQNHNHQWARRALVIAVGVGLSVQTTSTQSKPPAEQCPNPEAHVVAVIGDQKITMEQLDAHLGARLVRVRADEFQIRSKGLDEMIEQRVIELEAGRRGVKPDTIVSDSGSLTQSAANDLARKIYRSMASKFQGQSEGDAIKEISAALLTEQWAESRSKLVAELSRDAGVQRRLAPFRVEIDSKGAPYLGKASAPVEIVEYSDFQCPYCSKAASLVKDVAKAYPDTVRVVYKHFPLLAIHKEAAKAAEASSCAGDQGKFWEMHDRLFANPQALQNADLKRAGSELGLDKAAFDACLDQGKHTVTWQKHLKEGQAAGVAGTPTFYVNGRPLSLTAPPTVEFFSKVIDEELALQKASSERTLVKR
jgi:protein-disulfide isomerase